jgi:hypothetical protein
LCTVVKAELDILVIENVLQGWMVSGFKQIWLRGVLDLVFAAAAGVRGPSSQHAPFGPSLLSHASSKTFP